MTKYFEENFGNPFIWKDLNLGTDFCHLLFISPFIYQCWNYLLYFAVD